MKTKAEHATVIKIALEQVERTHRAHGRAVMALHRALADATTDHGEELGLGGDVVAQAAAPKVPPPND